MVYVLLVDGFEEIEALTPVDILRRCEIPVKTVGVFGKYVKGSHNINVEADILIDEVSLSDMKLLMLPGGPGYPNYDKSEKVTELINYASDNGIFISAICAAPSVIGKMGLLSGKKATCFPGFEEFLLGAEVVSDKAVIDGKFITGKGAGAAADFGFLMAEVLSDKETADKIKKSMQY